MIFLSRIELENHISKIINTVFKNWKELDCYKDFLAKIKNNEIGSVEVTKKSNHINIYFKDCIYNTQLILRQEDYEEEECVVCYQNTTKKTICKHSLCEDCVNNIVKYSSKYICPYCREEQKLKGHTIKIPLKAVKLLFIN